MLCDLNRLVSALAEQYTVQVLGRIEMPIRFLRRLRTDQNAALQRETLYIGSPADLNALPINQDLTEYPILCVLPTTNPPPGISAAMRTLIFVYHQSLDDVMTRISEIAFDLGQQQTPLSLLYQKLLPLRTVGGMLTCVATELDLPIMLVDDKQRITHQADTTETAMAASKLKARCPFYPNISALCKVGSTWDILPSREHFHMSVSPVEDFYLYLFDIAGPESQPMGELLIVYRESQLPKKLLDDLLILLRFIALSYCWPGASQPHDTEDGFLHAIFNAEIADNTEYETVLSGLGWQPKQNLYVLVFSNGGQLETTPFRSILQRYLDLLPGTHGFLDKGQVILVYDTNHSLDGKSQQGVLEPLRQDLRQNQLHCGISSAFRQITELRTFYLQAKQAVHFGAHMVPEQTLHFYEDCAFYHAMELAFSYEDPRNLISDGVKRLVQWDREFGTAFTDTLETYFRCCGNTARCAQELYLHVNTVKYRIGKIEEILDCSLKDGESYSKHLFSLKVLRQLQNQQ